MSRTQQVRFESAGGLGLDGRLRIPEGAPTTTYALFAHCFTCSKDSVAASRIGRAVSEHLSEITDRCPVHRTLTSEIHIESELVG